VTLSVSNIVPVFILVGSIIVVPILVTQKFSKMFDLLTKCYVCEDQFQWKRM